MRKLRQIGIDLDVHRAIESARSSFSESENDILRRLLLTGHAETRPTHIPNAVEEAIEVVRSRGLWAIEVNGERSPAANMKDAYKQFLLKLDERHPGFLDRFSKERSRSRRFVAKSPADLYDKSPHLAADHAQRLKDEWFFDTNLSTEQVAKRVRVAARILDLRYGSDVKMLENLRTI